MSVSCWHQARKPQGLRFKFTCCWNKAQWGDDLGNQPVQVGVRWTLDVQVPAANIVEGLVVLKKWNKKQEEGDHHHHNHNQKKKKKENNNHNKGNNNIQLTN